MSKNSWDVSNDDLDTRALIFYYRFLFRSFLGLTHTKSNAKLHRYTHAIRANDKIFERISAYQQLLRATAFSEH